MRIGLVRVAVSVVGAVLCLIAVLAWVHPAHIAAQLGVAALGPLGLATLRADLGAFFMVAGGFAVMAAAKRAPALVTVPLLLIGLALAGRFLALAVTPFDASMAPPMVAEAIMVGVLAAGRFLKAAP